MKTVTFAGYKIVANKLCLLCVHVFDGSAAPRAVAHEVDGTFQVVCGRDHTKSSDFKIVGFGHVVDLLPGLEELPVLHPGYQAEEGDDGVWVVSKIPDD
ncbi:MAG: hypothetical protein ROR55_20130 [Devosia sp.]